MRLPYILQLLGAAGDILVLGTDYLEVIVLGSVFQIFGTGLAPLIRNMGGALYAMSIMVAGFLANILLDYVFVWVMDTGVVGAAIATVLGQAVTMLGGLIYFLRRSSGRPGMRALLPRRGTAGTMPGILKVGLSPFGITFSNNITVILMNRFLISYGGNRYTYSQAAACYACIVYVIVVVYLLLQGVGDGCQPLVSRYYGVRDFQLMKKTRNLAYISGIAISAVCMVLLFLCRYQAGGLFGSSDSVRIETGTCCPTLSPGCRSSPSCASPRPCSTRPSVRPCRTSSCTLSRPSSWFCCSPSPLSWACPACGWEYLFPGPDRRSRADPAEAQA